MLDFEKIIVLMSAAVLLVSFAKRVNIPYPIALVLGGGLLSFIPGLDFTSFDPNVIMTVVLPPILYYASFWTSHNDFKKHFREISSLAIGLVIATTACVTLFFKWLFPDYSWALAFAFGAIVSPPDAAAATSILRRFPIGPKLITILEGESLVNDASALVLYRIATTAIVTGTFSLMSASLDFVFMGAGGVALGIFLGYALQTLIKRYFDPVIAAFSSFLIPYIVYVLANLMDVSGVLAVVAFGIVSSRIIFKQQSPLRRVFGRVTWDLIIILLNCYIFVLIGSQLDEQTAHMSWQQVGIYTVYAFLITLLMIIIRIVWACIKTTISYIRAKDNPERMHTLGQILKEGAVIGWVGMRGIVSLTLALALPLTLSDGSPLPGRNEVIYISFCVILFSLLLPGLTLPALINWLNLPSLHQHAPTLEARKRLIEVANEEISRLSVPHDERSVLQDYFNNRFRLWETISPESGNKMHLELARIKVVQAQRKVLLDIWERGNLSDKTLAELEHELDAEETQNPRAEL